MLHFPLILLAIALVGTLVSFVIGVRIHLSDEKVEKIEINQNPIEKDELIKGWIKNKFLKKHYRQYQ